MFFPLWKFLEFFSLCLVFWNFIKIYLVVFFHLIFCGVYQFGGWYLFQFEKTFFISFLLLFLQLFQLFHCLYCFLLNHILDRCWTFWIYALYQCFSNFNAYNSFWALINMKTLIQWVCISNQINDADSAGMWNTFWVLRLYISWNSFLLIYFSFSTIRSFINSKLNFSLRFCLLFSAYCI